MNFQDLTDFRGRKSVILDTCFVVHEIVNQRERHLLDFCNDNLVILTSFNLEELEHVLKKLGHDKRRVRDFLKRANLSFASVPVSLGDRKGERDYVCNFDENLLGKVHDPSDAILVVAAIKSGSDILTRDKHHLFTSVLENELNEYNIKVFNDLSSLAS